MSPSSIWLLGLQPAIILMPLRTSLVSLRCSPGSSFILSGLWFSLVVVSGIFWPEQKIEGLLLSIRSAVWKCHFIVAQHFHSRMWLDIAVYCYSKSSSVRWCATFLLSSCSRSNFHRSDLYFGWTGVCLDCGGVGLGLCHNCHTSPHCNDCSRYIHTHTRTQKHKVDQLSGTADRIGGLVM